MTDFKSSIVDLGNATMTPLQFAAFYPRFLTIEPRLMDTEYDWSRCVYSEMQHNDRCFYLQCVSGIAASRGEQERLYAAMLAREDQEERYWWFSAVNRLDIMRALKTKPRLIDERRAQCNRQQAGGL